MSLSKQQIDGAAVSCNRAKIVFSENKSRVVFDNSSRKNFREWAVDGELVKNVTACDNALELDEKLFFVELKGKNIEKAIEQICETVLLFLPILTGKHVSPVVAATRVPKGASFQKAFAKGRRKLPANLSFDNPILQSSPKIIKV